jgi:hypothetical protein
MLHTALLSMWSSLLCMSSVPKCCPWGAVGRFTAKCDNMGAVGVSGVIASFGPRLVLSLVSSGPNILRLSVVCLSRCGNV